MENYLLPEALLFVDSDRDGAENMAMDQQMLTAAADHQQILIRIYRWSEPTLSLGYFQKYEHRNSHPASSNLKTVRRKTGGGAIVHDHDWTYSVAVPNQYLSTRAHELIPVGATTRLYDCVHESVVQMLQTNCELDALQWSPDSQSSGTCTAKPSDAACSFLCFERRSQGDIVVGSSKVLGSAQRRVRGAVLQHGSLLLAKSEHAPSLEGIKELAVDGTQLELSHFAKAVGDAISGLTNTAVQEIDAQSENLMKFISSNSDPFSSDTWTQRV